MNTIYHPPLYSGSRYSTERRNRRAEAIAAQIPTEMLRLNDGRIMADVILRFQVGYHTARAVVRAARARNGN